MIIRMIQLSIALARIAQSGRTAAFNPTSMRSQFRVSHRKASTSTSSAIFASSNSPDDNEDEGTQRKGRRRRIHHQSRLASIYDEMFADDSDEDDIRDDFVRNTSALQANDTRQQRQDINDDFDFGERPSDIMMDNDFPQDLHVTFDRTPSPPTPARKQTLDPVRSEPIRRPPSKANRPPAAGPSPKFKPPNTRPLKAGRQLARPLPPAVLEYDYSHYDPEFGERKPGENSYIEFHDGMLEELGDTVDMTPPEVKKKKKEKQFKQNMLAAASRSETHTEQSADSAKDVSENKISRNIDDEIKPSPAITSDPKVQVSSMTEDPITSRPEYMPPRPTARAFNNPMTQEVVYSSPQGDAQISEVEVLEELLEKTQKEIYSLNDGIEFNVKSPKQVSKVLFGVDNESTNKDALEALAGGISNHSKARLASLILKYRKTVSSIKRLNKTKENKANGTHVTTIDSMKKGDVQTDPMATDDMNSEPLVLVDASAYIFRAYYSMPAIHRYDGEPTGATLGFCNMLNNLILTPLLRGEQPRIALIFDSKDGTNFRKKIYPEYKSNRVACPEDLIPQFDFVRDAADAYGILQLEAPGYEADDVIATVGTMALNEGCHVNILSGDKDLMQLVTENKGKACIEMIDPMKKVRFSHEAVIEKWGVEPKLVGDILALAGDSSDNIPGVPGIGPKIAASLIQEFGSLDELLGNLHKVKQKARQQKLRDNAHLANLSRELVELQRDISLEEMSFPSHLQSMSEIRMERLDADRLIKYYDRMGFRDLKKRVSSRLPNKKEPAPSVLDRYNSITADTKKQRKSTASETKYDNGNGFSSPSKFKEPPKPEDFSDVPF